MTGALDHLAPPHFDYIIGGIDAQALAIRLEHMASPATIQFVCDNAAIARYEFERTGLVRLEVRFVSWQSKALTVALEEAARQVARDGFVDIQETIADAQTVIYLHYYPKGARGEKEDH